MKIAITGGNGFIGSQLAVVLSRRGDDVRVLIRPSSDLTNLRSLPVKHCPADVRDPDSLVRAFDGCDMVFHTAAIVSFWKPLYPLQHEVNVLGTRNVVAAALRAGIRRLVHTSSVAALGHPPDGKPGEIPLANENTQFNWNGSNAGYKRSKYEGELEIMKGVKQGLDAVIVNPAVVIGPGDIHFNGGDFIRSVARGLVRFYIRGGGNIAYVEDVARGHIAAAEKGRTGERYILGGENLTHRQIFQTIAEVIGKPAPRIPFPAAIVKTAALFFEAVGNLTGKKPLLTRELVAGAGLHNWYSIEKAERELGYTITPFRTAVERTYSWYRSGGLL